MPLLNDPECAEIARTVAKNVLGGDRVIHTEPWMACESFTVCLAMWPGVFSFLGTKDPENGVGANHHNELFDINEDVMPSGAAVMAAYADEFLNNPAKSKKGWFDGDIPAFYEASGYDEGVISMLKYGTPYKLVEGKQR
ncbi:MAG: hypothetical protein Q4B67_03145 [Eubacteriales bacterium]|nr:hypothetical protein [Eubacteriales bacterium]